MKDTFFDRLTGRALRVAFLGGLIGMQIVACSSSSSNAGDDTTAGTGGTDSAGSAGTAQAAGGDSGSTSTGTSGGQATAGSTGSAGATGKGGAGGSGNPIVDAGPRTGPLKIMALGDSTTEFTCYRAELAKLLDKSHPKDYQFVGTRNDDFGGCGGYVYDKHNQGMSSYLVTSMSGGMNTHAEAPTWTALAPDVVLLHFATNDAWNSISSDKILAAWTYLIGEFRKTNPRVTILAAQLIPLDPMDADGGHSCSPCPDNVKKLNMAIPTWATTNSTAASRVIVVDQWTGYVAATDSCAPGRCDGVHPGPSGSVKMGAKWDAALEPLF